MEVQQQLLWDGALELLTGRANFNSVQFAIVPEPTSLTLFVIGVVIIMGFRWYTKERAF